MDLATRHDFEFTTPELSNAELEAVAGGVLATRGGDAGLANVDLQNALQQEQQTMQTISSVSKLVDDTRMATVRKIGG